MCFFKFLFQSIQFLLHHEYFYLARRLLRVRVTDEQPKSRPMYVTISNAAQNFGRIILLIMIIILERYE